LELLRATVSYEDREQMKSIISIVLLSAACTGAVGEAGQTGPAGPAGDPGAMGNMGQMGAQGPGAAELLFAAGPSTAAPTKITTVGTMEYFAKCTIDAGGNVTLQLSANDTTATDTYRWTGRSSYTFNDVAANIKAGVIGGGPVSGNNVIDGGTVAANATLRSENGPIFVVLPYEIQLIHYEFYANAVAGNATCTIIGTVMRTST
jgi:hypothetical protein